MRYIFGDYTLDMRCYELRHAGILVPLDRQVFELLAYLLAHADRVVTRQELFDHLWPHRFVSDAALERCIAVARRALGDSGRAQRCIKTLHGRGYRMIAAVEAYPETVLRPVESAPPLARLPPHASAAAFQPPGLVAREVELAVLCQYLAQALQGQRQVVFVTGEAGIGKTTLVDAFVTQLPSTVDVRIGHGQCIEHYGAGEAYLPVLEALGELCRGPHGRDLLPLLSQCAPSWLLQMPALVPAAEYEALQRRSNGTTRERMLRELTEAVETLTAEQPLVLVLEDLHWCDYATLDWLAYVARRHAAARLLVLGTYRPVEARVHAHPVATVTRDLQLRGQGREVRLAQWPAAGVAAYLAQRCGEAALPEGLVRLLHQRSRGNPLFLVTLVDDCVQRGILRRGAAGWELPGGLAAVAAGVPESLRQLLEQQLEQLPPEEQAILEAASVVGEDFPAAAVAAALNCPVDDVESRCAVWARQGQFVQGRGHVVWPDGTVSARYGFLHVLYPEVFYARVPVGRQGRWHQQIGLRLEAGYGAQASELAAALARHFECGRDTRRAVRYLRQAAEQALGRYAYQEASGHLRRGVELLQTLPDTPERAQQELDLQLALGLALTPTRGSAAPEVEQAYARVRALCAQVGDTPQLFPALEGLRQFYFNQGALSTARELGEQLWRLAQRTADPRHLLKAHCALGITLYYLGDYAAARTSCEQGIACLDPTVPPALVSSSVGAADVTCLAIAAHTLWCLGYPAQAGRRMQEALTLAQALAHPYGLVFAQYYAAWLQHRRRDAPAVQAQAEALLTLAMAQEFPMWRGGGTFWRGWARAMQGEAAAGLAEMRQGLAAIVATGRPLGRPQLLVPLAEALGHSGCVTEGLRLLAEALAELEATGQGYLLAEAYRLQGLLLLQQAVPEMAQAEACLHRALTMARHQQAKSLELQAAMSLSRLWQHQGRRDAAHQVLAEVYGWFTEGFETADVQQARALLAALAS
jgi:predicted ATPase/DNA-binding winged helix-turn-helix (wHTH) protein